MRKWQPFLQMLGVAIGGVAAAGVAHGADADAGSSSWKTEFASNVTIGAGLRLSNPSCSLTGDPNSHGCGLSANTAVWANGDDGNLNYKKNQFYTVFTSVTSELLATNATAGLKFMARGTAAYDFAADHTQRTPLSGEARAQTVHAARLLDLWGEKDFDLGDQRAYFRLGNQVINWGESVFASGGINATNSLDWQLLLRPGTQLKQALLPAPLLSFNTGLTDRSTLQAYYQLAWNGNRYPAVGTFWSASDVFGKGTVPASFSSANFNVAGRDADQNVPTAG